MGLGLLICLIGIFIAVKTFGKGKKESLKTKAVTENQPKKPFIIGSLIYHHFCIQTTDTSLILQSLDISFQENCELTASTEWRTWVSYPEGEVKEFIVYEPVNGWTYLQWNISDFESNLKMVQLLSEKYQQRVFYFFIDPWIFDYCWAAAENGILLRAFEESHGQIIYDKGQLEEEKDLQFDKQYWENRYWAINSKICQPIDAINSLDTVKAVWGKIKS